MKERSSRAWQAAIIAGSRAWCAILDEPVDPGAWRSDRFQLSEAAWITGTLGTDCLVGAFDPRGDGPLVFRNGQLGTSGDPDGPVGRGPGRVGRGDPRTRTVSGLTSIAF